MRATPKANPKRTKDRESQLPWRMRPPEFHPVLVVIDMQNGFCTHGGSYEKSGTTIGAKIDKYRQIIPTVIRMIDVCHELRIPVFYTQQLKEASGIDLLSRMHRIIPKRRIEFAKIHACVAGTWDAQIIDELLPTKNDLIVVKRRDSAFQDTEFELWLKSIGADTIIYTGIDTCICVENSVRDGFNLGYDVVVVEDAVASSWQELHKATLSKIRGSFGLVIPSDRLIDTLKSGRQKASSFRLSMTHL